MKYNTHQIAKIMHMHSF